RQGSAMEQLEQRSRWRLASSMAPASARSFPGEDSCEVLQSARRASLLRPDGHRGSGPCRPSNTDPLDTSPLGVAVCNAGGDQTPLLRGKRAAQPTNLVNA